MPTYEDFKTALQAQGEWDGGGVAVVWCGDAYIVHVFDTPHTTWQPRFASKSVRKVYRFVKGVK